MTELAADRVILSGIHEYYEPEELVGKTCVAITNLPPRPMMGIDSCGMLISAVHHEERRGKAAPSDARPAHPRRRKNVLRNPSTPAQQCRGACSFGGAKSIQTSAGQRSLSGADLLFFQHRVHQCQQRALLAGGQAAPFVQQRPLRGRQREPVLAVRKKLRQRQPEGVADLFQRRKRTASCPFCTTRKWSTAAGRSAPRADTPSSPCASRFFRIRPRMSVTRSPPTIFRLLYFEKSLHFNHYCRSICYDNIRF